MCFTTGLLVVASVQEACGSWSAENTGSVEFRKAEATLKGVSSLHQQRKVPTPILKIW